MNPEIKKHIKKYAESKFPHESCGLIVINKLDGGWKFVECENVARDTLKKFAIEDSKFLTALNEGEVIVFHSHFSYNKEEGLNQFSEEDKKVSEEACVPFLLYTSNDKWNYYEPRSYEPFSLHHRPFLLGFWDCYTFIRDYHRTIGYNMNMRFSHETDFHYQLKDFEDLTLNLSDEIKLEDIKENDMILFRIRSDLTDHVGIYAGNNEFWHHAAPFANEQTYPKKDILNSKYLKYVHKIIRYHG